MILKHIIQITNKCKPILLKVFPYKLLRKYKRRAIENSYKRLEKVKVLPYQHGLYANGINLIGNIKAETGLGQSCRLIARMIEKAEIPLSIYQYEQLGLQRNGDSSFADKITNEVPYDINLIHINAHEFGLAYLQMDPKIFAHRYNIAFWLWELEEFPDIWTPCFNCLHEIWTPSEFISKAIRKKTDLPVITVPYFIEIDIKNIFHRKDFDLPESKFLYLMMYDNGSIMERKNPIGTLKAFKMAFARDNHDVGLVIKINNCSETDILQITEILDGYQNVYFIKETLSRQQVNDLIQSVDVFVSLHRAEGFGLVLAEAMFLGTPTIATNWSSNTEFMNKDIACMVDYELIRIEEDLPPFEAGNRWADPDLAQAADYMKKLYEDKVFYDTVRENARVYVKEKLGFEETGKKLQKRIENIEML